VTEDNKKEEVETERIKLKMNQERHEVLSVKIKIEEIAPQHSIYLGASYKF